MIDFIFCHVRLWFSLDTQSHLFNCIYPARKMNNLILIGTWKIILVYRHYKACINNCAIHTNIIDTNVSLNVRGFRLRKLTCLTIQDRLEKFVVHRQTSL